MRRPIGAAFAIIAATLLAVPATAQFSDSYKFLKAVRDRDGPKAAESLDKAGASVVNTRDYNNGETGLHVVVKRRDISWLAFLLSKGAKPDSRDNDGNTPLTLAAQIGFAEGVQMLLGQRASVDLANDNGETPLILAVHSRDIASVRLLLTAGASPTRQDRIAGKSAHDYAAEDPRSRAILKVIDEAKPAKPKATMGPSL